MDDDKKDYCGFDDGQDWLDDLAIEDYMLNRRVEIPKNEKG